MNMIRWQNDMIYHVDISSRNNICDLQRDFLKADVNYISLEAFV